MGVEATSSSSLAFSSYLLVQTGRRQRTCWQSSLTGHIPPHHTAPGDSRILRTKLPLPAQGLPSHHYLIVDIFLKLHFVCAEPLTCERMSTYPNFWNNCTLLVYYKSGKRMCAHTYTHAHTYHTSKS